MASNELNISTQTITPQLAKEWLVNKHSQPPHIQETYQPILQGHGRRQVATQRRRHQI